MPELSPAPTHVGRILSLGDSERFRWALIFVVLEMIAAVRAATPQERDQYWSARAGIENLSGSPLIRADSWSWSSDGEWVPNSPVWNIVLGGGWQAGGFWGLFVVTFLSISAFNFLTLLLARSAGARALPTLVGITPLLFIGFAGLTPRATLVVQSLLFLAVYFAWWWGGRVRDETLVRSIAVVTGAGFALSFAGNWLHLSFMVMAPAIAILWALAWWASAGIDLGKRTLLIMGGTIGLFLGCLGSPYGIMATLEQSRIVEAACRGLVSEWFSIVGAIATGELRLLPLAVLALLLAFAPAVGAILILRTKGRFDGATRLILPLIAFGVPAVVAGMGTLRFILTGLLALLPVAAFVMTAWVDRLRARQASGSGFWSRRRVVDYTSGRFWTVLVVGLAVISLPLAVPAIGQGAKPPEVGAIAELPRGCRVWSTPAVAATVILTSPESQVWIDGRADFYGREHLVEYLRILNLERPLPRAAECVLLPIEPETAALVSSLDGDAQWWRISTGADFAAWARRD